MRKYEKLIILLEQEGVDVSPFINLKKNELATTSVDVLSMSGYKEIIENEAHLEEQSFNQTNPFILALRKDTAPRYVGDIQMNIDGSKTTVKSLFKDESKTETEKHNAAYTDFVELSNEYRLITKELIKNDLQTVKQYKKANENVLAHDLRGSVKKHIKLFWFLSLLLILFNYAFISKVDVSSHQYYSLFYNIVLNLLLVVPFFKIFYHQHLLNGLMNEDKDYSKLTHQCNDLVDLNDQLISRLETDLYKYSNQLRKKRRIRYLRKSRRKMMWIRLNVERILKHQNRQKWWIHLTMNVLNKGLIISVLILLILFFIIA